MDGPNIVSILPPRKGKEVRAEECLSGHNVRLDEKMYLIGKGGHPFRLLRWIEKCRMQYALIGGTDERFKTIPVTFPRSYGDV